MTNQQKENDYIDVFDILRKINSGIAKRINNLKSIILKNFLKIVLVSILSGGLGYLLYFTTPKFFESEMIIAHKRLTNDECSEIFEFLKKNENNIEVLSEELKLNIEDCKKIKAIRFNALNPKFIKIYADSIKDITPFKILVEVYDNTIYDTLQTKILNYLESNEYSVLRKQQDLDYYLNYNIRIEKVLADLDSLKKISNNNYLKLKHENNGISIDAFDPVKISEAELRFFESKLKLNQLIALNNSFETIKGFSKSNKEANVSYIIYVFCGLLIGFIAGIILLRKKA